MPMMNVFKCTYLKLPLQIIELSFMPATHLAVYRETAHVNKETESIDGMLAQY
jgi:hypothetical protein